MQVTIQIDQKWFEEHKKEFHYIDKFDSEEKPQYQIEFQSNNSEHIVTDEGGIKITGYNESITFIVVDNKPSIRSLINLAGVISKHYSRAKAVFEALQ